MRKVKLSKSTLGIVIAVLACILGIGTYLILTRDSRAAARMERQIGPLPEK